MISRRGFFAALGAAAMAGPKTGEVAEATPERGGECVWVQLWGDNAASRRERLLSVDGPVWIGDYVRVGPHGRVIRCTYRDAHGRATWNSMPYHDALGRFASVEVG